MRFLFEPTLTRRVAFALVGALVLVWFVLLMFEFHEQRALEDQDNPALIEAAIELLEALELAADPSQAAGISASVQRMIDGSRKRARVPGEVSIEVRERSTGQLVYRTPSVRLPIFRTAERSSARWTVRVGQSRIDREWLLRALIWDLTKYMRNPAKTDT